MTGWKIFDMLKKHFGYEKDEQFFHGYNNNGFTRPERDLTKDLNEIKSVNTALDRLKEAQKVLEWIYTDDNEIGDELKKVSELIDDTERELSNVAETIEDLAIFSEKMEEWGDDWKYITTEFFQYMLEKHADEIDDIGVVKKSINENYIKSVPAVDKFKL
jgi:DNA repair ATPase RecN